MGWQRPNSIAALRGRKRRFPSLFDADALKQKSEQIFRKKTREKVPAVVASRRKIGYTSLKAVGKSDRAIKVGSKSREYY
jgi:hypothetical protein